MVATDVRTTPRARRSRWRWVGWFLVLALAAAPWAWFGVRELDPMMDAVAIGLPLATAVLAVLVFGVAMRPGRMRLAIVSLSLVAFTAAVVLEPRLPRRSPVPIDPFRLVAANTYENNLEPEAGARALASARPDVVVVVETTDELLSSLGPALGRADEVRSRRLAVFARWPLSRPVPIPAIQPAFAARVEIDRPGAPFVVYAVHLPNPIREVSFAQQAELVDALLRSALAERLPVVVAGDFNMTDRSTSYRTLDGPLRDAMRSSLPGSTYQRALWALLQLRIDHVFVSPQLCATEAHTLEVPGSDHRGLDVTLGRCP
jgi:endonuclease/exonuclease/phosphatase (EEP) superfamily protein YafD